VGWLSNVVHNPIQAITGAGVGNAIMGPLGAVYGAGANASNAQKKKEQASSSNTQIQNLTPAQQQELREQDIKRGQARGEEIFVNDPTMQSILKQRQDAALGVNAQEYQGMRDDMIKGQQSANAGYMRQLLSAQGAGGVGGARAVGQQAELANQFAQTRADAERKLLLDNIALKREGTDSLQDFLFKQKYGTLAQGLGEAQLGVTDRTGYMQGQVNQAMANAAAQQAPQSLLQQLFGGII
jgi:hypothetical protein